MRQFTIVFLVIAFFSFSQNELQAQESSIKLKPGPVLAKTEVAKMEMGFVDLNRDKRPDLVVGSQWHVFDEKESKFSRTKMHADGKPISIHMNRSSGDKTEFADPLWPVSNKDNLYRLPAG